MAKIRTATRALSNAGRLRLLVAIASRKAVGEMPAESLVEYDGLTELLADPDIVSAQVQPETIQLHIGGVQRNYTPDVRFIRRDGRIGYREFKLSKLELDEESAAKLDAARASYEARGYEFDVRDAGEIRRGYRLENLRLLKRYASWATSEDFQRRVWELVGDDGETCLQDARDFVGSNNYGSLYRMLWDGHLVADLVRARLSGATKVRRGVL
jgi:hypothetical protein